MSKIFFEESVILLGLEADTKEEALEKMGSNLVDQGLVKESFIPSILKREKEYATGLPTEGVSVAIPHTDSEHVIQETISVAVLKKPVEFCVMGDNTETTPVKIIFMLAMVKSESHLTLLQKLMQLFQEKETLNYIDKAKDKKYIKKILEEKLSINDFEGGEK